jgi:mRNA interferase MazF
MRRGEIWLADLEPALPGEADKSRPVVVVSNDHSNEAVDILGRGVVTVVPLTSNTQRVLDFHVVAEPHESGLTRTSKAQPEQIRALSEKRFLRRLGALTPSRMWELDEAIALHLGLS